MQLKHATISGLSVRNKIKSNDDADIGPKEGTYIHGMATTRLPYTYYSGIGRTRKSELQNKWKTIYSIVKNRCVPLTTVDNTVSN